jgi:hypothetical protein
MGRGDAINVNHAANILICVIKISSSIGKIRMQGTDLGFQRQKKEYCYKSENIETVE